ncbi:copper amine oxidase N-terminal domain-containing protein [Brevibacillus ruminantium]|uniref:Copper amine oxidase N-terminal domain-containing protein n=1 Tax=Brevibacillus ruminantium TaxID=2950604 RepID=A0ABY4WG32_9BACL|nr:copper amine oxidase N-terminal domain-containing protein [Brevibacillus ruminantium]USG63611.1 copper amine oxidase N-terminal domain-containing protein [Brevibacillus ruminantium]
MEKSKKVLPIMLATALAATPFVVAPHPASAISKIKIKADDDETEADSEYTIEFTLDKDLDSGDEITVTFPKDFTVDRNIDKSDIDADFKVKSVSVSGKKITIKVGESIDEDDNVSFDIRRGITNPRSKGTYDIDIETTSEKSKSGSVKITDGGSSKSGSNKKSSYDDYDVEIDDNTEKKETQYVIGPIKLKEKLTEGDWITVTFPSSDMLPSKISKNDIDINKYSPDSVSVSGKKVEIKVPSKAKSDKELTLKFYKSAGITNPSAGNSYTIKVEWDRDTYESESFSIKKSGSSSSTTSTGTDFTVTLSDNAPGARSSYSFEADFGKTELKDDSTVLIELPSSDMIPGFLDPQDFTINGKAARKVGFSGNKLSLTTPYNFSPSKQVRINIAQSAWITNPKAAGDYTIKVTVDGKTATSKSFRIDGAGSSITTPTTPTAPNTGTTVPANNNTATVGLTNTAVGQQTGVNISVKAFGAALAKQRDFVEVVFPVGYKVPAYIAPGTVSVNGVASSFVAVRGQNVLVYPAQDIPAGSGANIAISAAANIVNPAAKNTYSISVFSSEEKGLLFNRVVGVGVPQPAQPQPTTPTPQPQPSVNVPANAALFKINTNTFQLNGKSYPLQEAPYLANGNTTMVPAQFFKEAMALTTFWNNNAVTISSGSKVIRLTVGSNKATAGNQEFTLPAPVALKNGMPMIPVRFVTDNLGYKVGWDAATSSVYVYN